MKKLICLFMGIFFLFGCSGTDSMDGVMALRSNLSSANASFVAKITADYGDRIYQFTLSCESDPSGELRFTVISPESITGISGSISASGGKLEFADTALSFPLLADGQLSPVSAPFIMMKALMGGYITSAGQDGEYVCVSIRDSYEDDAMTVDLWLNENEIPVQAEILWNNKRILTIQVENFVIG